MYPVHETRRSDTLLRFNSVFIQFKLQRRQQLDSNFIKLSTVKYGVNTAKTFCFSILYMIFLLGGMEEESLSSATIRRVDDQWLFASTMHVLVGIYT